MLEKGCLEKPKGILGVKGEGGEEVDACDDLGVQRHKRTAMDLLRVILQTTPNVKNVRDKQARITQRLQLCEQECYA